MNPLTIISTVKGVIEVASVAFQAGKDIAPYAKAIYDTFKNGTKEITQADLDALETEIDALSLEIQSLRPTD